LASCASLDVLEEARALHERFPTVPPRTLLAMATSFGAHALRLSTELGTLSAGKRPGLLAFEHHASAVPADPERFVLSHRARVRRVLARPAAQLPERSGATAASRPLQALEVP
jgi:cytosine/adenosine deaminase-related metal-dependent hydrolase